MKNLQHLRCFIEGVSQHLEISELQYRFTKYELSAESCIAENNKIKMADGSFIIADP